METLWLDVKQGMRTLARAPGLTAVAVLTLALGVGVNTAMFSVVHGVLLNPLPYPDSDRLVRFTETVRNMELNISYPNFLDWRARAHTLDDMAIYNPYYSSTISSTERAEQVPAAAAESRFFTLFGVRPALGRIFADDEEKPESDPVVLISHSLWARQFGRDPAIVGRTIRLNFGPATVIGVLPADFQLDRAEVWFPLAPRLNANSLDRANHPGFQAYGRMKRGVTLEQVREEMGAIARSLEQEYPASNKDANVRVATLLDSVAGRVRPMLLVLLGTVGFVLLIACANVSNVLLARALGRSREVAVRAALGAGSARLFRLFLTESLLLGLIGGAAGVLLASWGVDALLAVQPGVIPRAAEIGLHRPVLAFALGITLLCGVIFGTAPAWRAMRVNLVDALKQGARSSGWGGGTRLRWTLVTAQVALSVVLLIGAGLMIRTLLEVGQVDPGFRAENLLATNMFLPGGKYSDDVKLNAFIERALEETRAVGGIESAAAVWPLSLDGPSWTPAINFEQEPRPAGQEPWVQAAVVTPDFFRLMQIPVRAGRAFTAADRSGSTPVAIINEEFAQRFFPGKNPLGKRVRMMGAVGVKGWTEIVGVVGNTLRNGLVDRPGPELYWPFAQYPVWFPAMLVRTATDPRGFALGVQQRLSALDSDMVVQRARPMEEILAGTVADRSFLRLMLSLFSALALTLTVVGIYGAAAYLVSQRTQELGIRVALGAAPGDVIRLVLRQGLVPVGAGVGLGIGAALWLTSFIASRLYGVKATDPATFVAVAAVLALAALLACLVPARRATRVDPMAALRSE